MDSLVNLIVGSSTSISDPEFVARLVVFGLIINFIGLVINYLGHLTR